MNPSNYWGHRSCHIWGLRVLAFRWKQIHGNTKKLTINTPVSKRLRIDCLVSQTSGIMSTSLITSTWRISVLISDQYTDGGDTNCCKSRFSVPNHGLALQHRRYHRGTWMDLEWCDLCYYRGCSEYSSSHRLERVSDSTHFMQSSVHTVDILITQILQSKINNLIGSG